MSIIDRFRWKSVTGHQPLQASLELTNRCNERCRHCYIDDFSDDLKRRLDLKGWLKVLRELRQGGTLYVILMGGEPLLSPDFFEISCSAASMGFHVSMISNGQLISDLNFAQRLRECGLSVVTFSLYSLDPQIHDRLTRVRGSQEKTLRAIDYCREAGIEVTINSLLTNENIQGIFDLYDWCSQKSIEMKVDPMITAKLNGSIEPTKLRLTEDQLYWFYATRAQRWKNSLPAPMEMQPQGYVCNAAKGKCAVTSSGDLLPCIEIREPLGNLVENSFAEIWRNQATEPWREMRNRDISEDLSFCDHCPGMAKNEIGDPTRVIAYAKKVAEVKRRVYEEFSGKNLPKEEKSFEVELSAP